MGTRGHAEVAGGGIAGLTVATLLARRGWSVRVHERSPQIREIGSGIFIKHNALTVLDAIGVVARVSASERLLAAEIWDERGRRLQRRRLEGHSRVTNLPRAELVLALYESAVSEGVEVVVDSAVQEATPEGELVLESGRRLRADLVVAADGFRSRVREALGLTEKARPLRTGATRLLIPRTDASRDPMTREFWSGSRRIGVAACTVGETYVYMSCRESDSRACVVPVDVESWQASFPRLKEVIELIRTAEATHHPYCYVRCRAWSAGKVALIGDAAHAMPPTLGQGAGLAITNACALVEALELERSVEDALPAWERRQRWVTDRTQRWSLRYDALTTRWPPPLSDIRSGIIWCVGRARWLNAHMRVADRVVVSPISTTGVRPAAAVVSPSRGRPNGTAT